MNENYFKIHSGQDIVIKPGNSYCFEFEGKDLTYTDRLFFTGETAIFHQWKSEFDNQILYRYIDDALNTTLAETDHYCLDFSANFYEYPKIAFKKLITPYRLSYLRLATFTNHWKTGIRVKTDNLEIGANGYLHMMIEVRYTTGAGRSLCFPPDKEFVIDFPPGTYDWMTLEQDICFDANNTASVSFIIEGKNYGGKVYLEAPFFISEDGHNILPGFTTYTADRPHFNWMGQNLSRKEWPEFHIEINQETIYNGEIFERCHRYSETEIKIDQGIIKPGKNTLSFRLTSDFHDAPAYHLHEVGFLSRPNNEVVFLPSIVTAGIPFSLVLSTEFSSLKSDKVTRCGKPLSACGYTIVKLLCYEPGNNIVISINDQNYLIKRCVIRENDGVMTGTGDLVYINQNKFDFYNFLEWYLRNEVGNMMTFRPTYRWSGSRIVNESLWREFAKLLDSMGIFYAHMMDGRELPGCDANPTEEMIESEHFLGRQTHEFDGQLVYWGYWEFTNSINDEMFYDMFMRMFRQREPYMNIRFTPERYFQTGGRRMMFRDCTIPDDMEAAANFVVDELRKSRRGTLRHTGPATIFKYFYQAGYEWTGAELMYTPTEIVASALRGAASVYGNKTGAHLAVQWSTSPHDSEYRYRRYWLALIISYIQGIDEINTEEGLWHLEEYYYYHNRFSDACINHLKKQKNFYDYIRTHSRTGTFYTPIGFLNGRFDGWCCMGRNNTWGKPQFGFSDPEKSWDILTYFYPKSVLNLTYVHDCKNEPIGYFSGTPWGNVDILPIEAESYSQYRLLAAPGYNKALDEDMDKLLSYAEHGGTLILGWPQLSITTNRCDVLEYNHQYTRHPLRQMLADVPEFISDKYQGMSVTVSSHTFSGNPVFYTDNGVPLVYTVRLGQGIIYFINAKEYAGSEAVSTIYRSLFDILVPNCIESDSCYAKGSREVQFSIYKKDEKNYNVYFLATNWYSASEKYTGWLRIHQNLYQIPVCFGNLVKVTVKDGIGVYPLDDCNEVISINEKTALVQGIHKGTFVVLKDGVVTECIVDFTENSLQYISLDL